MIAFLVVGLPRHLIWKDDGKQAAYIWGVVWILSGMFTLYGPSGTSLAHVLRRRTPPWVVGEQQGGGVGADVRHRLWVWRLGWMMSLWFTLPLLDSVVPLAMEDLPSCH